MIAIVLHFLQLVLSLLLFFKVIPSESGKKAAEAIQGTIALWSPLLQTWFRDESNVIDATPTKEEDEQ